MSITLDVAVIGAGPAGLSAATALAENGASVLVLDEQPAPGGQIYRAVESVAAERPRHLAALGPDYAHGLDLVRRLIDTARPWLAAEGVVLLELNRRQAPRAAAHARAAGFRSRYRTGPDGQTALLRLDAPALDGRGGMVD